MRYQDISLDELEELEQEIHLQEEKQEGLSYSKIELYNAMYEHLTILAAEDEDYWNYYIYIQHKLIDHLICYSGQIASVDANLRYSAERALKKVLEYDALNPLASYRLACLFHQQNLHSEVLNLLQRALNNQNDYVHTSYKLNSEQIKRAVLFMSNSSLYLASQAFVASDARVPMPYEENGGFSDMFNAIYQSSNELRNTEYRIVSAAEERICSRKQCDEVRAGNPKNTILLVFGQEGPELSYNGITEPLALEHAFLLRYLLLESCQSNPMTPLEAKEFFLDTHVITGVTKPTFTKAAEGLLQVMRELEIPSAIVQGELQNQPVYFFNGSSKFMVIGRIDEELNLKEA